MRVLKFNDTNMLPNIKPGKWIVVSDGFREGDVVLVVNERGEKSVRRARGWVTGIDRKLMVYLRDDNPEFSPGGKAQPVDPKLIVGHVIWPLWLHDNTADPVEMAR